LLNVNVILKNVKHMLNTTRATDVAENCAISIDFDEKSLQPDL
jgi:hypothetical protein